MQLFDPFAAIKAHRRTRAAAERSGIEFAFTLDQWLAWWSTDDRWQRRGRKRGQVRMVRIHEHAPFAPDSVIAVIRGE